MYHVTASIDPAYSRACTLRFAKYFLSLVICTSLGGCDQEESSPMVSNRNVAPIKGRRDLGASEIISDALLQDQMFLTQDMSPPDNPDLGDDLGVIQDALPPDQSLVFEDMDTPCQDGDRRLGETCGFEECVSGSWVARQSDYEICNLHDDTCDGVIDGPPVPDAIFSSCCDDQLRCFPRSYCDQGRCVSLDDGACKLPGDCESYESCEEDVCVISHVIQPPASPRSCDDPIELPMTPADPIVINGDLSQNVFYTQTTDACGPSRNREQETQRGYEVVFSFRSSTQIDQIYQVRAQVSVNSVAIPSTLMVLTRCASNAGANVCHDSSNDPDTHEILTQFTASPNRSYFLILDTYDATLQQQLLAQQAQHADVQYEINLFTR